MKSHEYSEIADAVNRCGNKVLFSIVDDLRILSKARYQIAREVWEEYEETVPRDSWVEWDDGGSHSVFDDAPTVCWQDWLDQQEEK